MCRKNVLTIAAVAVFALAIGQVQADTVTVPNADFETIYKPGQTTITAVLTGWTQGVGPDCPIDVGEYAFSDQTTGDVADIPGWLGYDRDGWIAAGGTYGRDQTTGNLQGSISTGNNHTPGGATCYLANGGGWGNPAGGLIVSDASLGNILSNSTYTLSIYANGDATPLVLELLADGVILTPTSSVFPTLTGTHQEFTRTYNDADLSAYVGQAITIVCGVGRYASGNQTHLDDVSLTHQITYSPPSQATNPNPADSAINISLTTDLSWTAGNGSDSSDVYFGTDPTPDSGEFQGNQVGVTFDPGTLDAETTYYWRIDSINTYGTTTGQVWSFTTVSVSPPGQATNPSPADGATGISPAVDLNWIAGDNSESSDVYFGTNPTPGGGEFQGNQPGTAFDPGTMADNTTYYWRIDAVNAYGTTTGQVWSFTTIADSTACPPILFLPLVAGCDGLVLTDPSSIDTQSAGIITNVGGGLGGTDSTTVNNGESIDILDSGCFQLGKDGSDFALSFWLKATGPTQIIGTKTQYDGNQGFIVYVDGDSQLCVASSEGTGNTTIESAPFQLNEWVHVVVNYVNDGEGSTLEVNVNLDTTSGPADANVYNSNLRIGDEGWGDISSFDVCIFQSWGRVLSRSETKALYFDKVSYLGLSSANLSSVMSQLMDHMTGTTPLTGPEIEALTVTFIENDTFLDENMTVITEAFDLINYYETTIGPLFINAETTGGFPRDQQGSDGFELERAIFTIQQEIHDRIFELVNCQTCQSEFDGKIFETTNFFPGACAVPADPEVAYDVDINGTNPEMWGKPVCFGPIPARRPTGLYLAPGSVGEVTVPPSIVNQGFEILVGAHTVDKLKYYKSTLQRFDRVTKTFPIVSEVTSIANPFGGGIYIIVPYKANLGIVTVQIANVVQSPFFSATSTNQTTLQEWTDTERLHPGPWADFESDKFMMQVPTSWIYNYADPVTQMQDWDLAMDGFSEILGFPYVRNVVVLYLQPDISIQHGAYGVGYPQVNNIYNPNAATDGNSSHYFLTNVLGWSTTYHECGHCQLFSKFPGHEEAMVNLPYVYIATEKFGMGLVEAFTESMNLAYLENIDVDQAALTWFVTENFRNGNPMDITNSEYNEVRYQHRGYGRYVEIGLLFGWDVLSDFYYQEHLDYISGAPGDGLDYTDSRIFRLSKAAGVNLTPLIHCWGVHPVNPSALQAAIAAEGLPLSQAFYDRLVHYKDIIPADNAEFWDHYLTIYPTEPEGGNPLYQYGWYNVWKYIYDEPEGTAAKNAMQDIIDLYYGADTDPPTPDPATFASVPAAVSSSEITMTATTGSDATGPVEYFFDETSGNPGGTDSGWTTDPVYNDTGLTASTQYTYTVQMRDSVTPTPNVGAASTPANATTDPAPPLVDDLANADIPVQGTVSGSYVDTQSSNNGYESITEVRQGNPSKGFSSLEHKWTINVTGGTSVTFFVEAYQTTSPDGDNFVFAYSTDDSVYTDMLTVSKTSDDDAYQSYVLPGSLSGTVYIRVEDTDSTKSAQDMDTLYIDHMYIRSSTQVDNDPPTPDPMTWATVPYATGSTSIAMVADTASDISGVEYYFTCTAGGGNDSGWQDGISYEDTGLTPETQYTYTVTARDKSPNRNTTAASTAESATTDAGGPPGQASNPDPSDGQQNLNGTADLTWTAGADATSHDVYFGTSSPPPFVQNQTDTTYDPPGKMSKATWYYWRIDEVNDSGTTTGVEWSFKTR